MDKDNIEEYYGYIIEQLEFVVMITSLFTDEVKPSKEKISRCKELAGEIAENIRK